MPDAQPKPTAADVLREHRWSAAIGGCYPPCIWHGDDAEDEQTRHAQHQADMLAAVGLLATAERVELSAWPTTDEVRAGLGSARARLAFGRWLAEHDAQVAARAWAEGVAAGAAAVADRRRPAPANPYRAGGPHGTCTIGTDGRCTIPGHAHTDDDGEPT